MKIKWPKLNRKVHYWGAILCALPVLVVLLSGILLILKKEIPWVQPATISSNVDSADNAGSAKSAPTITMFEILSTARSLPQLKVQSWSDIDRLDVRPGKGIIKIRAQNHWEAQIDHNTGTVLQIAYRRSDIIESIHDGSFFHELARLGIFLPSSIILLTLWGTGLYLFLTTHFAKRRSRLKKQKL